MVTLIGYDRRKSKEGKAYYVEFLKYTADILEGECVAQTFNSEERHDRLFQGAKPGDQIPGLKVGYDKEKGQHFCYSAW